MKKLLLLLPLLLVFSLESKAQLSKDRKVDIWPHIPFVRGADLCKFTDAYGQTRSEYMDGMVRKARELMVGQNTAYDSLMLLSEFNSMYDRNQSIAVKNLYLDVTLESTFKSFIDSYYRKLKPRIKNISFNNLSELTNFVRTSNRSATSLELSKIFDLDYVAYGTYALAPSCKGAVQVTLHLVGKDGVEESFVATGNPEVVMSKIASEVFTLFQRTKFPSQVRIGNKLIEIVGGLNGSVDEVRYPELAEEACKTLDARLPTRIELELLDRYGDWSGGVGLGTKAWAMENGKIYHPLLMNPSPVRSPWEVNDKIFLYYCVR